MKMNRRGQGGLSMDTIIIAVIAIIVLLLIVTFFTGGMATIFGKIRNVFSGGTVGYDVDLAKSNCQDYCIRAQGLATSEEKGKSAYCTHLFDIKIEGQQDPVKEYCDETHIGISCPGVADVPNCHPQSAKTAKINGPL